MVHLFLAVASLLFTAQALPAQEPKTDITEKELIDLARRIELDQQEGREKAFDDLIDIEWMVEDSSAGLDMKAQEKTDFIAGYRESSLGRAIGAAQGNTYSFLKIRTVGAQKVLTFRLTSSGLTYHDLTIRKSGDGLKIADMFMYSAGESLKSMVRRGLIAVAASDPARRAKLPAWAADMARNLSAIQEFSQEAQAGDADKALKLFDRLPESLRKDRVMQTLRITAAARSGEAAYLKAAADYARHFPDDGYRDIPCLDALIARKDYAKAFESIDRIDRLVEGDPYLDVIRGRLHLREEKAGKARDAGLRAVKNLPKLQDPYWLMVEVSLAEKTFAETVERLVELEKSFRLEMDFSVIESTADYAEFVKSPEYGAWKKSRAAK